MSLFIVHYNKYNVLKGVMIKSNITLLSFRSQNKSFLDKALSEEVRTRRRRRYTISIKMTITSWSLELVTGAISLVNTLIFGHYDSLEIATQVLVAVHVFLYFVVIPSSYLLNTEVTKDRIVEKGWTNAIPRERRKNRVTPIANEETKSTSIEMNEINRTKSPVPTITGNVNLETTYKVY